MWNKGRSLPFLYLQKKFGDINGKDAKRNKEVYNPSGNTDNLQRTGMGYFRWLNCP